MKELQEMTENEKEQETSTPVFKAESNAIVNPNLTVSLSNLPVAPTHILPNIRSGTKCRPIRSDEMAL